MKIKPKYLKRCKNYVLWLSGDRDALFGPDHGAPFGAVGEFTAVEAMNAHESGGETVSCKEPYLLSALKAGKQSREFHVKGWLSMTRAGEALAEEFYGCLGLVSREEFRGIFGRDITLSNLIAVRDSLLITRREYTSVLPSSTPNCGTSTKRLLRSA